MSGRTIALIGFGEVGQALAAELARHPQKPVLRAHDLKFADPASAPSCAAKAAEVQVFVSAAEAALGADLVISAVTAAQTVAAAQAVAPGIGADVRFIDLNSASPQAKQAAADIIDGAGGRYVEAAVMSPRPTCTENLFTATRPPNRMVRFSTARRGLLSQFISRAPL